MVCGASNRQHSTSARCSAGRAALLLSPTLPCCSLDLPNQVAQLPIYHECGVRQAQQQPQAQAYRRSQLGQQAAQVSLAQGNKKQQASKGQQGCSLPCVAQMTRSLWADVSLLMRRHAYSLWPRAALTRFLHVYQVSAPVAMSTPCTAL